RNDLALDKSSSFLLSMPAHSMILTVRSWRMTSATKGADKLDTIPAVIVFLTLNRHHVQCTLLIFEINVPVPGLPQVTRGEARSEEHTSELQSRFDIVCRLML